MMPTAKCWAELAQYGTRVIALLRRLQITRDLAAAKELGPRWCGVLALPLEAVAEHAVGLMMTPNRRIHKA